MAVRTEVNFDQLVRDLQNKIYYPVYLLHGEEAYFIDALADMIEQHCLSEQEKEFNQTVFYGKDSDALSIVAAARRFPMMANYQVIMIKEAQDLEDSDKLLPYLEKPVETTILVICYKYGKLDKRRSVYKAVEKNGIIFESPKLYDNKIPEWISEYVKQRGYSINQKAAALLTEFVGADLSKIVNEIGKLLINITPGTEINESYVERNIGISKDFNVFELQKALMRKDVVKSNQIILHFGANPKENPLVKVIPMLYSFFSKVLIYHFLPDKSKNAVASVLSVNPYFVGDYQMAAKSYPPGKTARVISYLREYDLKAKGLGNVSATDGELMKELIFKILH